MIPNFFIFYGRFLCSNIIAAPTTIMVTIMPAMPGSKYRSEVEGFCVGCCVAAGAGSSIMKLASAIDGQ